MTSPERTQVPLYALLALSAVATLLMHAVSLPRRLPGDFFAVLPYLLVGWASYTVVFYTLGRLFASPASMPSMRAADLGLALFLGSVVLSGLLDAAGLTVQAVPVAHLLPAVGVYLGLALAGWGFGERTVAINRTATD